MSNTKKLKEGMNMPTSDGWDNEGRVYTVIQNATKNSKIVLSMLNGIEIGPMQTLDLRTAFRKSQVIEAAHEIASLIRTKHLLDLGEGAAKGPVPVNTGMPTQAEMQQKIKQGLIREISDSTNMSALEDWMQGKDQDVAKAAALRVDILLGNRTDTGELIPGSEETQAQPTQLIRSVGAGVGGAVESAPAPVGAGTVRRTAPATESGIIE
jgi:hypothetical protein